MSEFVIKPIKVLSEKELREKAMYLLSRREHSKYQLIQKLKKWGDSALIENIVSELAQNNFQNEQRFVDSKIESMLKKFGHSKIVFELKKAGVTEDLISTITDPQTVNVDDELERAKYILNKKYHKALPSKNSSEFRNEKARRIRFLQSRGFSLSVIVKAIAEIDEDGFNENL